LVAEAGTLSTPPPSVAPSNRPADAGICWPSLPDKQLLLSI
jgi:hypothetical protein